MIEFKNISKTYEDTGVRALDDVSFFIDKGEFVFLVGPSGAGKSTLTKLIIKEEDPNAGEIIVNGMKINELPKKKIPYLRRNIGMVFQNPDNQIVATVVGWAFAQGQNEARSAFGRRTAESIAGARSGE